MLLYDRHEPAGQGDGGRLAEVVRLQRRRHDEDRRPAGPERDVQLPETAKDRQERHDEYHQSKTKDKQFLHYQ